MSFRIVIYGAVLLFMCTYHQVECLLPTWVSRASATQRRGRAGRTQPGVCYHLFTKAKLGTLSEYQVSACAHVSLPCCCVAPTALSQPIPSRSRKCCVCRCNSCACKSKSSTLPLRAPLQTSWRRYCACACCGEPPHRGGCFCFCFVKAHA